MKTTKNYQLNQWDAADRVMRQDFNADNQKIDAALGEKGNCRIAAGSYVGDGLTGSAHPCRLTFPFPPKLVILNTQEMSSFNAIPMYYFLCPGMTGFPCPDSGMRNKVAWTETGLSWYFEDPYEDAENLPRFQYNEAGKTYRYLVIG